MRGGDLLCQSQWARHQPRNIHSTPRLTLAHVNAQTFQPGYAISLQRGGTWNEPLIVPSSGTNGNPISFDAYGTGAAPVLTAAAPALTWIYNSGNIWSASLPSAPASGVVMTMQFGSLWGQYKAPVSSSCLMAGVIVSPKDFCSHAGYVYVYDSSSTNGSAAFYGTTITPILTVATGYQLISVSNKKPLRRHDIRVTLRRCTWTTRYERSQRVRQAATS